ncbi:MAG: hypothetical protein ABIJ65_07915 [Chloroflexota bacterium]
MSNQLKLLLIVTLLLTTLIIPVQVLADVEPPMQASGIWLDNWDYSIQLIVKDLIGEFHKIRFMQVDKGIYAIEYPSIFSGRS